MRSYHFLALLILIVLFSAPTLADIYRYTDNQGISHYVTAKDQVPQEYRSQLENAKPLPRIGKNRSPDWQYRPPSPKSGRAGKPVVLVMRGCGFCRSLERLLQENRVSYDRLDIHTDQKGQELYQKWGKGGVPILLIGDQMIRGYKPDVILKALKKR